LRFPGIIPAVIVPFTEDDHVDAAALADNVAFLLEHEIDGVVVNGTMGEAGSLTMEERALVLRTVVELVSGRVPVIAGVSAGTTAVACAHAVAAREGGASGVMCLPPLNYRGTPEETVAFYAAVADAAELPVMAYNNPEASGLDMTPQLIAHIAEQVDGVVAVKECSGDARRIPALIAATDLEVLIGGDDWALEGYATGATGWVSGVANVAPRECVALQRHVQAGQLAEARAIYQRLLPLARLDMTPWLVQYFKGAMDAVGLQGGPSRAPRLPLGAEQRELLREAVEALGVPAAA
jgi:4-hydroxy-tetrahydrodipicolinate synthase